MTKAPFISLTFCVWTFLLAPLYWFIGLFASWNGPEDDIAIIYILAMPIVGHGLITAKYGLRQACVCAFIYFSLIAALCSARHIDISNRMGYSQWHANRSLESLAWTVPWFAVGLIRSYFFKPADQPRKSESVAKTAEESNT